MTKKYRHTRVRVEFVYVAPRRHQGVHAKLLPIATTLGSIDFVRAGLLALGLEKGSIGYFRWQLRALNEPKRLRRKRGGK